MSRAAGVAVTEYKEQRLRDGTGCEACGWKPGNSLEPWYTLLLQVHHVIPRRDDGDDLPENLILLCPTHHAIADALSYQHDRPDTRGSLVARLRHLEQGRPASTAFPLVRPDETFDGLAFRPPVTFKASFRFAIDEMVVLLAPREAVLSLPSYPDRSFALIIKPAATLDLTDSPLVERAFLKAQAGAIVAALHAPVRFEVAYYDDKSDLKRAWGQVEDRVTNACGERIAMREGLPFVLCDRLSEARLHRSLMLREPLFSRRRIRQGVGFDRP